MATYLPTVNLSPLWTFVAFSGTASALQAALNAAFPGLNVQCFADAQVAGNALVVVNDTQVLSVAPTWFIGLNQGQWSKYAPAALAGGVNSTFTAYP